MSFILQPWQFFVVILVGWVNRKQQEIIEFYQKQVEALMKLQGKQRLSLVRERALRVVCLRVAAIGSIPIAVAAKTNAG